MLLNCGVRESVLDIHWKDWCWSWNSNTLATWCEELTHFKKTWCWERLKAEEGDDRRWDDWICQLLFIIWKITSQGIWVPKTLTLNSQPLEFQTHYEFPLSLPLDRGKCLITSLCHLCGCAPRYLYIFLLHYTQFPLVAQMLKNLPVMWDTRVLFLGWEDPLEKGTVTHYRILENSMDLEKSRKESDMTEWLSWHYIQVIMFVSVVCAGSLSWEFLWGKSRCLIK